MRKNIVAGNWKMNMTLQDGQALVSEIVNMVQDETISSQVEVVVAPPFPLLPIIGRLLPEGGRLHLGAQNCHQKESGAFTGEVSAKLLASVGTEYVILGHSERRQYFGEDDELLSQKLKAALGAGLKPIFCVGESLDTRESGDTFKYIEGQLKDGLFHLSNEEFEQVVVAYEPIWAIGTGKTATSQQAQEVHAFIREQIARAYDAEAAQNTTILYGGSANAQNARELFSQPDVDGGLIGGASLKSRDFVEIIKSF
ncbi:triose-phosphate isomerase [Hymenobacter busanensis]|uniref:Triosephosphate isomerase n=1 Tax=Hymenobacter busanensis TaxID=2607656 RepID=A0A7L5A0N6_9BACT|nr:triose-phosphate isomerase [Hymenobacter busanensis]KAA9331601.1 triose-phosphate isomerase [Hymenobacter busanensis]QHJ08753.1 triose-phosphate isomerase [Hymenobacter busanensis]